LLPSMPRSFDHWRSFASNGAITIDLVSRRTRDFPS
jgi:hypothetical protein